MSKIPEWFTKEIEAGIRGYIWRRRPRNGCATMDHYEVGLVIPRAHPINGLPEFLQSFIGWHVDKNGEYLYPKNVFFTRESLRPDYNKKEIRQHRERTAQARKHFGFTDDDVLWGNQYVEWSLPEDEIKSEWPKLEQTARLIARKSRGDFINDAIHTTIQAYEGGRPMVDLLQFLQETITAQAKEIQTLRERNLRLRRDG